MSLLELFVSVDDFCQAFLPIWERKLLADGSKKRCRAGQLSLSEVMTILIYFHQSRYRNFKAYYKEYVCKQLKAEFPNLVSYERFVILMPSALGPLSAYLKSLYGRCRGISFIDSTALEVCDNHRIHNHKVLEGFAERGKGSMGWFYGLKLHLVVNDRGEILACQITPGNVDESTVFFQYRKPVPALCKHLFGKLIADRGYLSQPLFEQLLETFNVQLITRLKKNMKNRLMPVVDKLLLRKRAIIESVIDQLKNISQIEHIRHRSPINAFINIIAGLIAYCHQPKKPSLNILPNHMLPFAS
jgi:Transposase DDE domain